MHNGLGMYATWVTIATLLNVAMLLAYEDVGLSQHIASTISLSILAFEIVVFAYVDNILLEK